MDLPLGYSFKRRLLGVQRQFRLFLQFCLPAMLFDSLSCASVAVCGFVVNWLAGMIKLETANSEGWVGVVNFL